VSLIIAAGSVDEYRPITTINETVVKMETEESCRKSRIGVCSFLDNLRDDGLCVRAGRRIKSSLETLAMGLMKTRTKEKENKN